MTKSLMLCSLLFLAVAAQASTKPESRWLKAGKTAHAQVRKKNSKDRNRVCTALCKKSGAKKARDLGACKEGCVFG
jgi:hypothetical protein